MLREAKAGLLTAGIACISVGVDLLRRNEIWAGVILVVLGLALVLVYTYLVEVQASARAVRVVKGLLKEVELVRLSERGEEGGGG